MTATVTTPPVPADQAGARLFTRLSHAEVIGVQLGTFSICACHHAGWPKANTWGVRSRARLEHTPWGARIRARLERTPWGARIRARLEAGGFL